TLFSKHGLTRENELKADHHLTYSLQRNDADVYAVNIDNREGSYTFDVNVKGKWLRGIELNMGGLHNIENAVAAIAVAKQLHIDDEKIKAAIAAMKGVKRRIEYIMPP